MLLSLSAANVFAQSSLIATLSHEREITAFYGADALKEAHGAAAHGDAITLSSGTFNATDITKAITLRGAGMQVDTVNNVLPTTISGDFTIEIAADVTEKLTIEGIYHSQTITFKGTLSNAMFLKNRLGKIYSTSIENNLINCNFISCRIATEVYLYFSSNSNVSFLNSVVLGVYKPYGTATFTNCVILAGSGKSPYNMKIVNCINSIICGGWSTGDALVEGSVAYNCLAINCGVYTFEHISNSTNVHMWEYGFDKIFKTQRGHDNCLDSENFELTEEAKTKYLGVDDTQIGIHGGNFPYDPTTTNPQITKCNVAAKSTADGKLSVDIEVAGVE